jgi:hypothetical protein
MHAVAKDFGIAVSNFVVEVDADQAGTIEIDESTDQIVWQLAADASQYDPTTGILQLSVQPAQRFVRAKYTNGSVIQTRFSLHTGVDYQWQLELRQHQQFRSHLVLLLDLVSGMLRVWSCLHTYNTLHMHFLPLDMRQQRAKQSRWRKALLPIGREVTFLDTSITTFTLTSGQQVSQQLVSGKKSVQRLIVSTHHYQEVRLWMQRTLPYQRSLRTQDKAESSETLHKTREDSSTRLRKRILLRVIQH